MQGSLRLCPSLPKRPDAEPEPETELTPIERAFPAPLPGGGFPVARCGRTEVYRIVLAYLKALPERLLGARGESHRPSPHTELLPRRILEEIAALCRADARCPLPTTKILVPLVGLLEEVCGAAFHVLRTACVSGWSAGEIAAECRHLLTAETTMCATARNEVRPAELRILGGLAGRSWLAAGVRRQYGNPSKFDPEASVGLALGLVYVARFASGPASDESKVSINGLLAAALEVPSTEWVELAARAEEVGEWCGRGDSWSLTPLDSLRAGAAAYVFPDSAVSRAAARMAAGRPAGRPAAVAVSSPSLEHLLAPRTDGRAPPPPRLDLFLVRGIVDTLDSLQDAYSVISGHFDRVRGKMAKSEVCRSIPGPLSLPLRSLAPAPAPAPATSWGMEFY